MYITIVRHVWWVATVKRCKIIDYACFSGSADNCLTQRVQKQLPVRIRYWHSVHVCVWFDTYILRVCVCVCVCVCVYVYKICNAQWYGGVLRDSKHARLCTIYLVLVDWIDSRFLQKQQIEIWSYDLDLLKLITHIL